MTDIATVSWLYFQDSGDKDAEIWLILTLKACSDSLCSSVRRFQCFDFKWQNRFELTNWVLKLTDWVVYSYKSGGESLRFGKVLNFRGFSLYF